MIKIETIWGSYLSNTIGPSQTLKRMLRNKQLFVDRNIDYSVISLDATTEKKDTSSLNALKKSQGLRLIRFMVQNTVFFALLSIYFKNLRHSLKVYRKWKIKKGKKPDIIVFHDSITYLICKRYANSKKAKIILFHHGGKFDDNMLYDYYPILKKRLWLKSRIEKLNLACITLPDRIVFINPESYHDAIDKHKELAESFILITNGIDDLYDENKHNNKAFDPDRYNLVTIGTVNERKNQLLILKALKRALDKVDYQIHLTIVGDGPLLNRLVEYATSNNMSQYIDIVGNQDDVSNYLVDSDIFVLSSNKEGLPISLLEAMSFQLPIISTNISGARECVFPGKNGILYETNDVEGLTEILCTLTNYDMSDMGKSSRELFKSQFQFKNMQESYIKLLISLFGSK